MMEDIRNELEEIEKKHAEILDQIKTKNADLVEYNRTKNAELLKLKESALFLNGMRSALTKIVKPGKPSFQESLRL